jgi:hypothetical protein
MTIDKEKLRKRLNEIRDENMRYHKKTQNVIESLSARAVADVITDIIIEINNGDFEQ